MKIDINLPSNEYFPKSIVTKPKNDQGKSYNDRTDRQTNRETDIENYNIDINVFIMILLYCFIIAEAINSMI